MIRKFAASSLVLFCASIIEATLLSNLTFLPAIPDFSLLCVLCLSLHNGRLFGETSGFVSGIFLDFLSAAPFGFNSLVRTLCGYLSGIFTKTINTSGTLIPCILGLVITILKLLITALLSLLYPSFVEPYSLFSWNTAF
ncbi:MAG: rod shape-determining protein MreD, partial [Treponema sp.]|nr:rod shape-determining protein MreD [Treponema sp.]